MAKSPKYLMNRYGLSDVDCGKEVSGEDLEKISCSLWRKLPKHLGLEESVVDDLERDFRTEEERRGALLKKWKRREGFDATYIVLIKALLDTYSRGDAEEVCKLLVLQRATSRNSSLLDMELEISRLESIIREQDDQLFSFKTVLEEKDSLLEKQLEKEAELTHQLHTLCQSHDSKVEQLRAQLSTSQQNVSKAEEQVRCLESTKAELEEGEETLKKLVREKDSRLSQLEREIQEAHEEMFVECQQQLFLPKVEHPTYTQLKDVLTDVFQEQPVVITPEGNPLWLSTEEVLSKGLPESEVENFKNFYFKHAHSLQSFHDALKDVMVQTEFVTLSKEEIDALTVEDDVSEEQQQVLNGLQDRINAVIELYEKDGAIIKINGRSAKDTVMEKNDETFVQTIQDAVINSLEIEKQSCSAYSVWKDQEHHPGAFKRGINKIKASFRRSRAGSAGGRRRPKLEEERGYNAPKDEEGKREEPKPAEEGKAAFKEEGEAEACTVQVEVEVETEEKGDDAPKDEERKGGDKPEEAAAKDEEPKEEATAEPAAAEEPPKEDEPKDEVAPEPASEVPKEAAAESPKEEKEDSEIQATKGDKEEEKKEGKSPKRKSAHKKQKMPEEYQCKEAKTEPLDNRILRAFGRVVGSYYRAEDGKAAVDQLRSSTQIRNDLNKLKTFGGVEGVQVSLSVCRWLGQIPEQTGMQFRGFVYDNELTALTQYNDNVYFPNVVHYNTIISGKVQQFFQDSIKEPLKDLKNYLIDFFVAPDKAYVLRLSPFYTAMGACLFTWNGDGRVLTKGPFQIRVVNAPKLSPDAYSSFQPWWQEMLTFVLQQRKESESRPAPSGRMGCVIL